MRTTASAGPDRPEPAPRPTNRPPPCDTCPSQVRASRADAQCSPPQDTAAGRLPGWQILRRSGANFTAETTNDETEGRVRRFSPAPRASHLPRWWSLLRAGCASCVPQLPPARGPCECDTAPWVPIRSQGGSHLTAAGDLRLVLHAHQGIEATMGKRSQPYRICRRTRSGNRSGGVRWPGSRCRRSRRSRTATRCPARGGCARTARSGTTPGRDSTTDTG